MRLNPIPVMAMLFSFSCITSFGQKKQSYTLLLNSGAFVPEKNIIDEKIDTLNRNASRSAGKTFVIIQFEAIPTTAQKDQLKQSGIELLNYVPNNAYTAIVSGTLNTFSLKQANARAIVYPTPEQKMQIDLAKGYFPSWSVKVAGTVDVWIKFPKSFSFETVSSELKQKNFDIISTTYQSYGIVALRISAQKLKELAALPFVEYVQPVPQEDHVLNHQSVPNARANVLNSDLPGGRNLKGDSVVIGIGDDSNPLLHVDFFGRLINRSAIQFGSGHGIHVTGTAAGAGIRLERFKGYAPKATIIAQNSSNILAFAPQYVNDYGMVVTNNSYGNIVDCNYHGTYDLYSYLLDQMAFDLPELENVFAAGNSGGSTCSPYPSGFRTVLGGFQSAKNVISVANTTETGGNNITSSRGPVLDGRLKPDISAQGTNVYSTYPVNDYIRSSGTSMASPAVSGGLALLYQRYRQLHGGANPKNALMKAAICNGGTDIGNVGPDFSYGFGWMNLLRSVQMIESGNYYNSSVANGITNSHDIVIPPNTAQLKVMLYWNDPPAVPFTSHTLINDLDLKVIGISSDTTLPKILNPNPGNVNDTAVYGEDHVNNMEQVVVKNPVAGTYKANVIGTAVTQNPSQEYSLVYDVIPVSTTITHPIGGEKLVPGDSIFVSWDSYGDPENTFTVSFSQDNGSTWTDSVVSADSRMMKWFAPNIVTNQAKFKVVRNSTALSSTSEAFTIIGAPVDSLTPLQCEGYISLGWKKVNGATDYEVMVLKGSEMVSVGTTVDSSFVISGLSKDSVYWLAVRARINGSPGRRSTGFPQIPNIGTCSGNISDNDLKMDAIISPSSGRKFTSSELSASTTISARIKNLDDAAVSKYAIKYSVNGGAWVTDSVFTSVAGGATNTHNFSTTYDFSSVGTYTLRVAVVNPVGADTVNENDTLTTVIKQLDNAALDLTTGFLDDIESAQDETYFLKQVGLDGLDRYDFITSTTNGRIRSFVNTGIAYSGSKALTLDADRYNAGTTDSLTATFNIATYDTTTDDIRLDFRYKNHGQTENAANRVWVRGNDTQPWIQVYDLYANQNTADGSYKKTNSIELSDSLSAHLQNFGSSFQVRWGQWGQILAADDYEGAGYTFDDIHLYKVTDDISMISIDSPITASCGLSNMTQIVVTVHNSVNAIRTNIPVKYSIDGNSPVTETIASIDPNEYKQYSFTTMANLSALGNHTIKVWVDYATDTYRDNDTAMIDLVNSPVISSFPYLENFEDSDGSWFASGVNSSWEYGTPASTKIAGAASGSKAWKTRLSGNYNDLENSYLYSPCFNVSGMTNPTLSMSLALDLEDCGSTLCDKSYLEYSTDGVNWTRLGSSLTGTNWYNKNYNGDTCWSIQDYTHWHVATTSLPKNINKLRLRIVLKSDPATNREGIAIDDIHIYDNTDSIYNGVTMGSPVSQTISGGNSWIDFTSGGKLVASIQPNGQNMGNTDVQAFINTGGVRDTNGQYYHDRNITIKPANTTLADSVTVRFYFLDSETEDLINATSCPACSKPSSAYELGVSKYTDPDKNFENGTILDNVQGAWLYILPADAIKVPFDKGYYAEFKVKNFSEFWLNNGGITHSVSLPVQLIDFTATKQPNKDVLLNWTVARELNVNRYEIEVAKGNSEYQQDHFVKIGQVNSIGNYDQQLHYSFTDIEANKTGVRYYRLKIIDNDGMFKYSDIRPVIFNDEIKWQVYPNPSTGVFNLVFQSDVLQTMQVKVYDMNGKLIKEANALSNGFVQKLIIDLHESKYASGLYLINAVTGNKTQSFTLMKQ